MPIAFVIEATIFCCQCLSKIALLSLEMSSIQKLLSEKGKPMFAYDSCLHLRTNSDK